MNYFIKAVANNSNAECGLSFVPVLKRDAFFVSRYKVSKKGILFWGIYSGFIKHKLQLLLIVGKQEISFAISVFKGSKDYHL
jgi:hypothetical protein